MFLGRPRWRKSAIWHFDFDPRKDIRIEKAPLVEVHAKGPSIPAPAYIFVPDTRLGSLGSNAASDQIVRRNMEDYNSLVADTLP